MQNGSLISTCFDPFVVHFLVSHCKQIRLETCWLITGIPIKLMDYWIIHCIKLPVIKLSKSKSPWTSGKKRQICAAGELANLWMWLKWTFWLDQLANYFLERHFFFFFFFFFALDGLFDMRLANKTYCTRSWGILGVSGAASS